MKNSQYFNFNSGMPLRFLETNVQNVIIKCSARMPVKMLWCVENRRDKSIKLTNLKINRKLKNTTFLSLKCPTRVYCYLILFANNLLQTLLRYFPFIYMLMFLGGIGIEISLKTSPQYFNVIGLFSFLYDWHFGSHDIRFFNENFKSILFSQILKNPKMPMPSCQNAKPPISTTTSPPYNSISL
jgi:hypothetical protein